MRTIILLLAALGTLTGQTVNITVTGARTTKTWPITLVEKTTILSFTCDKTEMEPGDLTTCTITLSAAPRSVIPVSILVPEGFTGPDAITFPIGMRAQSFQVTRTDLTAATGARVMTGAYAVWTGGVYDYRASLEIPCCARIDHCETTEPVSQIPCAAR